MQGDVKCVEFGVSGRGACIRIIARNDGEFGSASKRGEERSKFPQDICGVHSAVQKYDEN